MGLIQDALMTVNEVSIKAEMEREVVVYARVQEAAGFEQAVKSVFQDQAQIKTDHGSIRVRKTIEEGNRVTYEMTSKVRQQKDGIQTMLESTVEISEEAFVLFRAAAPARMVKNRYYFNVEKATVNDGKGQKVVPLKDLFYEVDIFYKADGSLSEWVKIDVEIQGLDKQLAAAGIKVTNPALTVKLSQLPFAPTAAVMDGINDDPDKVELIKRLYDTQFLIRQHEPEAA